MQKTIGIVGSRSRNTNSDYEKTRKAFLSVYVEGDTICSGLCPSGADRFAVILADLYGAKAKWFPALWDDLTAEPCHVKTSKYGKSYNVLAGLNRNTEIAKASDVLIAVVAYDRTGGTEDTIKKFIEMKGIENLIIVE